MFSGTFASDAFARTILFFSHYQGVDEASQEPTPQQKRESELAVFRMLENISTATYLGTKIPLLSRLLPSIVDPDYIYPKTGVVLIITPLVANAVAGATSNEHIKKYAQMTSNLINTAAKIINLALTVILVNKAFGREFAFMTAIPMLTTTLRDLQRMYPFLQSPGEQAPAPAN